MHGLTAGAKGTHLAAKWVGQIHTHAAVWAHLLRRNLHGTGHNVPQDALCMAQQHTVSRQQVCQFTNCAVSTELRASQLE